MGILQEDDQETGNGLEMIDHTSSSSNSSSGSATLVHEVNDQGDGVWSDHKGANQESYYTRGDKIRFGVLLVLTLTLIVTISAKVGVRNNKAPVSASPTVSPMPTPAPSTSPAPTVDPLRAQNIVIYINSLTLTQRELKYPSEASTEEKALKWIIEDDPLQRQYPDEAVSIRERYVLSLLWFQSDEHFTDNQYEGYYSDYNYTSSWMTDHYECEWTGVTCTEIADDEGYGTQLITEILLYNSSVHGVLSPDIALLQSLVRLQLHVNSISSPVPPTLASLPYLRNLDLGTFVHGQATNNSLTHIPGDNNFSEPVPPMIGNIRSLLYLSLAGNDFYGSIPVSYENLVNMTDLLLYNNSRMDGQIPDFSQSTNLQQVLLYNNSFSGTLPEAYFLMEYLNTFDVSGNSDLGGWIEPLNATGSFSPFESMNLHSTNLTGSLEEFCDNLNDDGIMEFAVDIEQVDCPCCHFYCPWPNETEWVPVVGCDA